MLLSASTLTVMAGTVLSPVLTAIRHDLDLTETTAGLLLTAHGLSLAVTSPLAGRLVDTLGPRRLLSAGLLLYGVAGSSGLLTTSYPVLIALRLLFGVGAAVVFVAATVALLSLCSGTGQDRLIGWRSVAISCGGIVWPLVSGALGSIAWSWSFAVYFVAVPLGVMALFTVPESRVSSAGPRVGSLVLLRRKPVLLSLYALSFLSSLLLYVMAGFLPQRLAETGLSHPFLISLYIMATSLFGTLGGLAYVRFRGRLQHQTVIRTAAVCWMVGLVVAGLADRPVLLILAPAFFGSGMGIAVPALTVLIGRAAPPSARGLATSMSATAAFTGQFCAPLLIGPLIGATSLGTGFLAAAAIAAVVVISLSAGWRLSCSAGPDTAPPDTIRRSANRPDTTEVH
ncbi:MFS transporter [Nocardiopsis ansamitocini]|uniref:MFS transporter n=1 Tax=Nocardiopsis ansamitocini TaxID=1670832 RepID=A0A9W6UK38_9ACTN|nr:MFS transporter [Nocardiopsis ansamitocini]